MAKQNYMTETREPHCIDIEQEATKLAQLVEMYIKQGKILKEIQDGFVVIGTTLPSGAYSQVTVSTKNIRERISSSHCAACMDVSPGEVIHVIRDRAGNFLCADCNRPV